MTVTVMDALYVPKGQGRGFYALEYKKPEINICRFNTRYDLQCVRSGYEIPCNQLLNNEQNIFKNIYKWRGNEC